MGLENIFEIRNYVLLLFLINVHHLNSYLLYITRTFRCETCALHFSIYVSQMEYIVHVAQSQHISFMKQLFFLSLPWNQETLIGYIAESGLNLNIMATCHFLNGVTLMSFISFAWILQSFFKMFRHSVERFNKAEKNCNENETLCKLINFQNMTRELVLRDIIFLLIRVYNEIALMLFFLQIFYGNYTSLRSTYYDSAHL